MEAIPIRNTDKVSLNPNSNSNRQPANFLQNIVNSDNQNTNRVEKVSVRIPSFWVEKIEIWFYQKVQFAIR